MIFQVVLQLSCVVGLWGPRTQRAPSPLRGAVQQLSENQQQESVDCKPNEILLFYLNAERPRDACLSFSSNWVAGTDWVSTPPWVVVALFWCPVLCHVKTEYMLHLLFTD